MFKVLLAQLGRRDPPDFLEQLDRMDNRVHKDLKGIQDHKELLVILDSQDRLDSRDQQDHKEFKGHPVCHFRVLPVIQRF